MNNDIHKSHNVPPFLRWCSANIPGVFDNSMTYYETLCALTHYLQHDVVESINANADVTEDFINKVNELKEFVENYFDNLDVQEEVNRKLDEMVESGELGEMVQIAISLQNYSKNVISERIINGQNTRIACVGDSLTWCQKPNDTSVQLTTWASMIQSFINDWYNNANLLTCENYGVKGELSNASLNKFNSYIINNPNAIIWGYGTNDMTQGVTVDGFLNNLKNFYQKCVENNIELIVIIAPPSFQTMARREKMLNLARAERIFCKKFGIKYVDMFEYVDNLYSSNSYKHNLLQPDNTHFSDYTCYRDAIISKLFGVTFNQDSKSINYVDIGNPRNFFHTNAQQITVSADINPFNIGYRMRQENTSENEMSLNLHLNKKSIVKFITYGNSTAGKIDYRIDNGSSRTIDTKCSTSGTTTDKSLTETLQIGGVIGAGLHQIRFTNPVYPEETTNGRIYIFGFIIEEINETIIDSNKLGQNSKEMQLWFGDETSLTDLEINKNISLFNKIIVEFGTTTHGISYSEIYPHNLLLNFEGDGSSQIIKYFITIPTSNGVESGTIEINHQNNTLNFSTINGTVHIRRIYGLLDNTNKMYKPLTLKDING